MSLLQICRDAADEIGIQSPSFVATNEDVDARRLFRFANRVGNRLMKAFMWQVLRAEKTFTGISGEIQTGILPDDFDRFVPETFWDRSSKNLVIGPVSAVEWAGLKATDYTDTCARKFIHRESAVLTIPPLGGGESLAFEYIKNTWAKANDGTPQTRMQADLDGSFIDEELLTYGLVFEYLDAQGLPAQKALMAYEDRFGVLVKNDQPSGRVLLTADIFRGRRRFNGAPAVGSYGWFN